MIQVSISELQKNMNGTIMPRVRAGESIEVIDRKSGEVKFQIIPPSQKKEIQWPDMRSRLIVPAGHSADPVMEVLNAVRQDRF